MQERLGGIAGHVVAAVAVLAVVFQAKAIAGENLDGFSMTPTARSFWK